MLVGIVVEKTSNKSKTSAQRNILNILIVLFTQSVLYGQTFLLDV